MAEDGAKPGSRSRKRELALAHARKNGYTYAWPPPPLPGVRGPDDFRRRIAEINESPGIRSGLLASAAVHAATFFEAIEPADCMALGQRLVDLSLNRATTRLVRLRAIQAAIRPLIEMIRRAARLQTMPDVDSALLERLEANVRAFIEPLGRTVPGRNQSALALMARELVATGSKLHQPGTTTIRAIQTLLAITVSMMDTLLAVRAEVAPRQQHKQRPSRAKLRRARAEFAELEAQARSALRVCPPAQLPAEAGELDGQAPETHPQPIAETPTGTND